jgi:hypothetical protein
VTEADRPQLLEAAKALLSVRVGEKNALPSRQLALFLGLKDDAERGTVKTREIIAELVRGGMPVGASERGYFVLETEQELDDYLHDLTQRELGIRARHDNVLRAWKMAHGEYGAGATPAAHTEPTVRWNPTDDAERV